MSIDIFYSSQWFVSGQRTPWSNFEDALAKFWPSLLVYARRHIVAWRGPPGRDFNYTKWISKWQKKLLSHFLYNYLFYLRLEWGKSFVNHSCIRLHQLIIDRIIFFFFFFFFFFKSNQLYFSQNTYIFSIKQELSTYSDNITWRSI